MHKHNNYGDSWKNDTELYVTAIIMSHFNTYMIFSHHFIVPCIGKFSACMICSLLSDNSCIEGFYVYVIPCLPGIYAKYTRECLINQRA